MGWMKNRGAFTPDLEAMQGAFTDIVGLCYGGFVPAESGGGTTIPDTVFVGCAPSYSMPVDHAGTAEYVMGGIQIPANWDMTSDFKLTVWFAQAAAETVGEKYAWNFQHIFVNYQGTLGTYNDLAGTLTLGTAEGAAGTVQYQNHYLDIALPYHNILGTAERGGWWLMKLHRRSIGTTGEALLMGLQLTYDGSHFSGEPDGTQPAKLTVALREAH
jgi:hypothetical protein